MKEDFLEEIDNKLKLIANSSVVVFVFVILSKIFTYVYRIIIAKSLGPETYGLFSLALIVFTFFVYFSSFGLEEGILRYVSFYRGSKKFGKIKYILKFSRKILFFSSIISGILLFLFSDIISTNIFHNPNLSIYLKISSIIIPLYVFSNIYLSTLKAFEKITTSSFIVSVLQNIVKLIAIIFFIILGFKENTVMFSFLIGVFAMLLVSYYFYKKNIFKKINRANSEENIKIKKEIFHYSLPIMFSTILASIFYGIDSFMIGYFENAISVGFYNAAILLALLFGIATDLFMQMFYPLIVKEFSKNNFHVIKELSQQVGKWIFVLNIPLFIFMFFFSGEIINLLFGPEYIIAGKILKILSIGGFIAMFNGLLIKILLMYGKSKMTLINLVIGSIIHIILNIILIPKYSLQGAAIATIISWIFLAIILFTEVKLTLKIIPLRRKIFKIILISIIPTFLLISIKKYFVMNFLSMGLLALFFTLTYLALILITGCFDKNDLLVLREFKKKFLRRNRIHKTL